MLYKHESKRESSLKKEKATMNYERNSARTGKKDHFL